MAKRRVIDLSVNNRQEFIKLVVNPASLELTDAQNNQQVTLLDAGTINLIGSRGVKTLPMQSFFPAVNSPLYQRYGGSKTPVECRNMMQKWKDNGMVVRVIVTDLDINLAMTIDSLTFTSKEGDDDIYFNANFTEYKTLNTPSVKVSTQVKNTITTRPAVSAPSQVTNASGGTNYTVKSGDNLWNIAKTYYKDGSKNKVLYNANKDVIEATAKRYGKKSSDSGWWIYPGTKLVIP